MSDLEERKNESTVNAKSLPGPVAAIIGMFEPHLLVTEDRRLYLACRDAIIEALDPPDAVDATLVIRYVQCCWSIERFRRAGAGLINLAQKRAVGTVIREYLGDGLDGLTPETIAEKWFTDPIIKKRAVAHLARFAVDESGIVAQAMAMRTPELVQIDEMLARTEAQALWLLRELDRRRDAAARRAPLDASRAERASEMKQIPPPVTAESSAPLQQ
jgi:hypothetical protein